MEEARAARDREEESRREREEEVRLKEESRERLLDDLTFEEGGQEIVERHAREARERAEEMSRR